MTPVSQTGREDRRLWNWQGTEKGQFSFQSYLRAGPGGSPPTPRLSPVHTRLNSSAPAEQGWRQRLWQEGQGPSSLQWVMWVMTGGTSLPSQSPLLLEHSVT